jgi:hypothetical protein
LEAKKAEQEQQAKVEEKKRRALDPIEIAKQWSKGVPNDITSAKKCLKEAEDSKSERNAAGEGAVPGLVAQEYEKMFAADLLALAHARDLIEGLLCFPEATSDPANILKAAKTAVDDHRKNKAAWVGLRNTYIPSPQKEAGEEKKA